MADPADLNLLARQNERMLNDIAGMRDDIRVMTAMAMRQDSMLARLLDELRAIEQKAS
jgi:hypothetical protein